jgi:sec-independent protein translocase protein TatA
MPSWIGPWEIGILVIVLLVVFGPKRLPELGSSLGKAITGFRKGLKESEQELRKSLADESTVAEAAKAAEAAKVAEAAKAPVEEKVG